MPRNTREYIQRFADQALNDLERSLDKLAHIRTLYGAPLPDVRGDDGEVIQAMEPAEPGRYEAYIQAIDGVGIIIAQAHELLMQIRAELL